MKMQGYVPCFVRNVVTTPRKVMEKLKVNDVIYDGELSSRSM